jgi:hypothetical protein
LCRRQGAKPPGGRRFFEKRLDNRGGFIILKIPKAARNSEASQAELRGDERRFSSAVGL